jgi:hypothetical protein
MADPIRQALESLLAAEAHIHVAGPEYQQARDAALAALAAKPPAPGPTTDDIWELCEDHEFHLGDGFNDEESAEGLLQIINAALARWGNPAPAPAADGEREELIQWLDCFHEYAYELGRPDWGHMTTRAAALLRQPAPAPVPVAERPWERPGWCDAEGECWWRGRRDPAWWTAADPRMVHDGWLLPHWAIPRPPQGGEVAE